MERYTEAGTYDKFFKKDRIKRFLLNRQLAIAGFLVLEIIIFSLFSENFFKVSNLINVIRQVSIIGVVSFGMTFVIINKGIDLSVGSVVALSGMVAATMDQITGSLFLTIFSGIIVGIIIGLINGVIIEFLNVADFIATLAMLSIARGIVLVYTEANPIYNLKKRFVFIGQGWVGPIPTPVIIAICIFIICYIILRFTRFGRLVYAVGGNKEVARLTGINVKLNRVAVYTFSGFMAGIGGILLTARSSASVSSAGTGYELDAIAAVVLGGTSLFGGKGSIIGTVFGLLVLGFLSNGLILLGMNPFWIYIVKGVILLIAVSIVSIKK